MGQSHPGAGEEPEAPIVRIRVHRPMEVVEVHYVIVLS